MTTISTLRRRRAHTIIDLDKAVRSHRGQAEARKQLIAATAELLRAELNRRKAEPLLKAQASRRQQTGDLFSQAGA